MRNRYRIIKEGDGWYEAQIKYWWFPFHWFQIDGVNTHCSIERAKKFIEWHKDNVVWNDDPVDEVKRMLKEK